MRYLRAGRHPLTKEPLPPAVDEQGQCMAYDRSIKVDITRLEARKSAKGLSKYEYPTATSSSYTGSTPAAEKCG